jgi:Zn-dependent M28 family amino/carboxypeptidase
MFVCLLHACAARTAPVISATAAEQLFSTAVADLARFDQPSNEARFDVLTGLLTSRGIAFAVEPFTIATPRKSDPRTQGRNVVVTISGREPEIVVGAHYDAVRMQDGTMSKGAVDNAASVLILMRLADTLTRTKPNNRVRIVFFDMEELGLLGSEAYVKSHGDRPTLAMVNLDVNAFGDTLIFGPRTASNASAVEAMRQTCFEMARPCLELPRMPPSDDLSFQKAGIPTLSLASVPELEAHQLWLAMNGGKESGLQSGFRPQVLRTIHSTNDTASLADPRAMAQGYRAVSTLLARLPR